MLKTVFFLLCLVCFTGVFAQADNKTAFARYIKVVPTDSLLKIKEPVKNQLNKFIIIKRQQRLVFTDTDRNANIISGRWLAAKQKQDLYWVDLSSLVSKYIGETEKNLEQVFRRAEERNWVLFFDEADALFGERSDTNTAVKKESNSNQAYFLQRIKEFKGIVLIACTGVNCLSKIAEQSFTLIK